MMLRLYQEGGIIKFLKRNGLSALADLEKFLRQAALPNRWRVKSQSMVG